VEQRQAAHHHVVGLEAEQRGRRHRRVAGQVGMGQLGPLGPAGGARGVQDHRRVVVRAAGHLGHRRALVQQPVERARLDGDEAGPGRLRALGGFGGDRVPGEDERGAGVAQVVLDLAGLQQRVHRDHHGAGAQHPVVEDRELHHVRQHQPDAVARSDASRGEQPRRSRGALVQVPVGQGQIVEPDRHPVPVHASRFDQVRRQVRHRRLRAIGCCTASLQAWRRAGNGLRDSNPRGDLC
jgi:hypothetical protein